VTDSAEDANLVALEFHPRAATCPQTPSRQVKTDV
jgi:hypothetical protein